MKQFCVLQAAVSGSFDKIQSLASLMAALNKYRPSLVVALVDFLVEEVVSGLQQPSVHTPQASIAYTRLLCELYNFQVIKTSHLFSILYLYITIGAIPAQQRPRGTFPRRCVSAEPVCAGWLRLSACCRCMVWVLLCLSGCGTAMHASQLAGRHWPLKAQDDLKKTTSYLWHRVVEGN